MQYIYHKYKAKKFQQTNHTVHEVDFVEIRLFRRHKAKSIHGNLYNWFHNIKDCVNPKENTPSFFIKTSQIKVSSGLHSNTRVKKAYMPNNFETNLHGLTHYTYTNCII